MSGPVRPATPPDVDALAGLWDDAARECAPHRGGAALLADLRRGRDDAATLRDALAAGELWVALEADVVVGFAWVHGGVIAALYVSRGRRRRGYARALVGALLADPHPPTDGYALPGDRASKSLYESIGWKARLLTMRAG
ncbi:MAG TPA: GNAT family N-acetyltransferase [Acidimicrobiales bacterium]|nr:MAG: hypothetical protein B7Z69_08445 [Actinobacteria bacterium 21-73-9]HQU25563.1 GNAT family N-acetyltransferase [Acidimicrobiales bacterium]